MSRADPLRIVDYLQHVIEAIDSIQEYTAGMNLAAYLADRKTRDAVIRNLEVVGEACNNIAKNHPEFAAKHSPIPWGFAYEMRNALSHGYFTVDHAIVWQTIQQDLPKLRAQISVCQTGYRFATLLIAASAHNGWASGLFDAESSFSGSDTHPFFARGDSRWHLCRPSAPSTAAMPRAAPGPESFSCGYPFFGFVISHEARGRVGQGGWSVLKNRRLIGA